MNHSCRLVSSLEGSLHPASKPWRFATSRGEKYRISPAHSPLNGPASLARPVPTSTSQCSATNASDASTDPPYTVLPYPEVNVEHLTHEGDTTSSHRQYLSTVPASTARDASSTGRSRYSAILRGRGREVVGRSVVARLCRTGFSVGQNSADHPMRAK